MSVVKRETKRGGGEGEMQERVSNFIYHVMISHHSIVVGVFFVVRCRVGEVD